MSSKFGTTREVQRWHLACAELGCVYSKPTGTIGSCHGMALSVEVRTWAAEAFEDELFWRGVSSLAWAIRNDSHKKFT